MHIFIKEICAGSAPSNGAIWDEIREQNTIFNDQFAHLLCKFNAHFGLNSTV